MKLCGWMLAGAFLCAPFAQGAEPIMAAAAPSARVGLAEAGDVIVHPGDLTAGVGTHRLASDVAISGDTALLGALLEDTARGEQAGAVLVFQRSAGSWGQQASLVADDNAAGDQFGASIAIHGDTAIVGAPGHDSNGLVDSGAVYVFRRVGVEWQQRAKLAPVVPAAYAGFGRSVSLEAGTLVVGATQDGGTGAVYVFVGADTTWLQQARIVPASGRAGDNFGGAVALHGDTVIVGASGRRADPDIRGAGSAFVFVRTDGAWTPQAELRAPNATATDFFGNSVALHGDTVLVGAYNYGSDFLERGAVFAFRRSGTAWSTPIRLIAPGADFDGQFGSSVALSATRAIVGARWDSTADFHSGAAYVFADTGTGWALLESLTASDALTSGEFGAAVALDGTTAVIGAPDAQRVSGSYAGAAYFFVESGNDWPQQDDVDGGDDASLDLFGYSMAVSGDTLVVGAPHEFLANAPDVAAFVYARTGEEWVLQASLSAPDGFPAKHFGSAVAIDGDTIAVGTWYDEAVNIFTRADGVWTWRARIVSPDSPPNPTGQFSASLALQDGTLVVGAPEQNLPGGQGKGVAYVFTGAAATWTLQARLSDPSMDNGIARVVALAGDVALLGASGCFDPSLDRVLVFVRNGTSWTQEASLLPDASAGCQGFGSAMSASGNRVLIGAMYADAAYLFERNGASWRRLARFAPGATISNVNFGSSVALSQDAALVGVSYYSLDDPEPGAAHLFLRSGDHWSARAGFYSPIGARDKFGHAVALSAGRALVSAPVARGTFSGHYKVGVVHDYDVTAPLFFSGFE